MSDHRAIKFNFKIHTNIRGEGYWKFSSMYSLNNDYKSCIRDIRALSQKIVYIGCYWKINEGIELVFSRIKNRLPMPIVAKYHTFTVYEFY